MGMIKTSRTIAMQTGMTMTTTERLYYSGSYRRLRRSLLNIKTELLADGQERVLPIHTMTSQQLQQQAKHYARASTPSYALCKLSGLTLKKVQIIEAQIMIISQLLNHHKSAEIIRQKGEVKPILVALHILFEEFKDDRNQDSKARLKLFILQINKLLDELDQKLSTHFLQ